MTAHDLIDNDFPLGDPPDTATNARSLQAMAEGIHYDTTPGELSGAFQFLLRVPRAQRPAATLRWQRALPPGRVLIGPRPIPRPVHADDMSPRHQPLRPMVALMAG